VSAGVAITGRLRRERTERAVLPALVNGDVRLGYFLVQPECFRSRLCSFSPLPFGVVTVIHPSVNPAGTHAYRRASFRTGFRPGGGLDPTFLSGLD
jgi:hypothetical protein